MQKTQLRTVTLGMLALSVVLTLALGALPLDGATAQAAVGDVAINATNFPDGNFRAIVAGPVIDKNQDGMLSAAEIAAVTELDVSEQDITSLQGVGFFTALEGLWCYANQLTALDVSKNINLEVLYCSDNQLTDLDVSKNINLESLLCYDNQLTVLDISKNTKLELLKCSYNHLMSLDVGANINLEWLYCSDNQLTALDVSKNINLELFDCDDNQLTALDVSNNINLKQLYCYDNQLTALDVSKNVNLEGLSCSRNQLAALDVSKNTKLEIFRCGGNQLTVLDVSNNINLEWLECFSNLLTALDVSKNVNLEVLWCHTNQLTALDVSKNVNLELLDCSDNQLTVLDVSKNSKLELLNCANNYMAGEASIVGLNKNVTKAFEFEPQKTGFPPTHAPTATATPTSATVLINGKAVAFDAYNIAGNNYFKLRDIALALSGTAKQFEVGWDAAANAISLTAGKAYTKVGGELTGGSAGNKEASPTASKVYLDGKEVQFTAYNIADNNYFKLRDIGKAFDFGVGWSGVTNTITVDTSVGYEE